MADLRRPLASPSLLDVRSDGEHNSVERSFHDVRWREPTGTQAIDRAAQLLVRVVEARAAAVDRRARRPAPACRRARPRGSSRRLERQGLVQRLGDRGRLTAGPVLLRYANRDASSTLVELAAPSLRRLADASGETINLAVPGVDGVEHLAQEDTAHFVGVTDWVGRKRALRARRERQVLPRLRRRRRRRRPSRSARAATRPRSTSSRSASRRSRRPCSARTATRSPPSRSPGLPPA